MGLVHFLHGNPDPPEGDEGNSIRCPNENCRKKIKKALLMNGKKVCPNCKKPLPASLLKKIEGRK